MNRDRLAVSAVLACSVCLAAATAAIRPTKPSTAEALAFVAGAEAALADESEYVQRASWVQNTYITSDTNWLVAKARAQVNEMSVRYAKEASRFDDIEVDPVTRRKLTILKRRLVLPAPSRPGAAQQLAEIGARLDVAYSTAKLEHEGKRLTLDDMEAVLRTSRDPNETRALWEGWRKVSSPQMKDDYVELVALANEGARELGYEDTGELWRSGYDMEPADFAAKMDRLWRQVAPLYEQLHCHVRAKLNERYGDAVQPAAGPIRADLTGNMWAQSWANIYDVVTPEDSVTGFDLTEALVENGYTPEKIVRTADDWYQSIGFAPLPRTFWEHSMLERPRDREVVCHASASNIGNENDLRVKACFGVTADDFGTAHHELGHNIYQRAYNTQPFLFQGGANDGFHEAIGDFAGLNAVTPKYLKHLGLLEEVPGPEADIPHLLKTALDRVAFLPFGLLIDKWRWMVFSGEVTANDYNAAWWTLRRQYQGIAPPGPRPADAFDPGAKFHIPHNTPYMRYFLARIYQFQFYRAACREAEDTGSLNRCSVHGHKEVGQKLDAMLKIGRSTAWPEALAAFTGERDIDASALAEYFAPLEVWLEKQNEDRQCGW